MAHALTRVLLGLGLVVGLYAAGTIYLAIILRWEDERTAGLGYYGLSAPERARFKRRLRFHALLLSPLLWISARLTTLNFRTARVQHQGVSFPAGSCSVASCAAATAYQPRPQDVF